MERILIEALTSLCLYWTIYTYFNIAIIKIRITRIFQGVSDQRETLG
jgi:hypothetical protein